MQCKWTYKQGLEKEATSGWGLTGSFFNSDVGSRRSRASERLEKIYTVDLLDRVAQAYEVDLKAFNYTYMYRFIRSRLLQKQDIV